MGLVVSVLLEGVTMLGIERWCYLQLKDLFSLNKTKNKTKQKKAEMEINKGFQ